LLRELGIEVFGYVVELGGIAAPPGFMDAKVRDNSPVYTLDPQADLEIVAAIDAAQAAGDTLGGIVETVVTGCPIGLGSHAQWDRKLDARLAAAVMSIQAIKAVEIGLGIEAARRPGSRVMDPIRYEHGHTPDDRRFGFRRPTNNAGGIEGGTSNGEPIIVRAAKKPISTLAARGPSVNMATKAPAPAAYERSDVCAVPAASVIVENVVAFEVAAAIVEKYVGTSLEAIKAAMSALHQLNSERLSNWDRKVGLSGSASVECSPE
jgi:chorismate synthase